MFYKIIPIILDYGAVHKKHNNSLLALFGKRISINRYPLFTFTEKRELLIPNIIWQY